MPIPWGKAAKGALPPLASFTILPIAILSLLPPDVANALRDRMGLDLPALVWSLVAVGIGLAIVGAVRGATEPRSPVHLAASIASPIAWLYFTLVAFGLGDPGSFGVVERRVEAEIDLVLDLNFQFVLLLFAVATGITIARATLAFRDARRVSGTHAPPPSI